MQVRVLGAVRMSLLREGDEQKVSFLQQRQAIEGYTAGRSWTCVGIAEDLDVSAKIDPWNRDQLGPWLTDRVDEWDVLVLTKIDRLVRSTYDCVVFARWLRDNEKSVVFIEDGITLDYRPNTDSFATSMSHALFTMMSIFADMEWERISGRGKEAKKYLRTTTRWAGGMPPFGYVSVDHPEGKGKILVKDSESAEWVREMAKMTLNGSSMWDIATHLNDKGVLTASQKHRPNSKRAVRGVWNAAQVGAILRSPTCMGIKVTSTGRNGVKSSRDRRRAVVDPETLLPMVMSDPIFTDTEWAELQAKLDERSKTRERSRNASPLLGIAICGLCGRRLYRNQTGRERRNIYYRCVRTEDVPACAGQNFTESELLETVDWMMEHDLGKRMFQDRRFVKGLDASRDLEVVKQALADLREEWDMGLYGRDERPDYLRRVGILRQRKEELEALPQKPDGWEWYDTGETYAQVYERLDVEERRQWLLRLGVQLRCHANEGPRIRFVSPGDFGSRLSSLRVVESA